MGWQIIMLDVFLLRPVETGVALGGSSSPNAPQSFAKVDLLPIENDSEKKKVEKKI